MQTLCRFAAYGTSSDEPGVRTAHPAGAGLNMGRVDVDDGVWKRRCTAVRTSKPDGEQA